MITIETIGMIMAEPAVYLAYFVGVFLGASTFGIVILINKRFDLLGVRYK